VLGTATLVAFLALQSTSTLRGVVVDAPGGTPIRSVSVRLQSTGRETITDDKGRFEFPDVAPGNQELYVSAVDFILVKRTVAVPAGVTLDVVVALTEGSAAYAETVTVSGLAGAGRREPTVAGEQTLGSRELQQLRGILTNDPLRAVQALPSVAAGDDFRSEFAVRGAGLRQMNFTFEGIATPFLLHTVQQVHDSGSVAMVNGDILEEVSLLSGAYPQRYGNRTGAEIDFHVREGARDRLHSHLSVSALDASAVAEGPIGRRDRPDGKAPGSWLFSIRKSYLDLVVDKLYPDNDISFGFVDAQAKFAYDVSNKHQLQVAFTGGRSQVHRQSSDLGAGSLREAGNRSALTIVTWRYAPNPAFSLSQKVAAAENTYGNISRDGVDLDTGGGHEVVYRADLSLAPASGALVEAGGEARWSDAVAREQRLVGTRFQVRESFSGSAVTSSAYLQTRLHGPGARDSIRGWSVTPGVRVDRFSLVDRTTASPWIQGLLPLTRTLTLRAGAGIHRQEPGFAELQGSRGTPGLGAERAYHADVGLEGSLGSATRWQMTVYNREDRDLLRLPLAETRLVNGALVNASLTTHVVNALDGHARGIEWLVHRRAANGFSGWASYALGYARYTDHTTGERFWGDLDQRHTLNLYGTYRLNDRFSVSGRFRAGSNFPATGYWSERGGAYFVGADRNDLRVPGYARLDVRANRTFAWNHTRLTLFMEAINLLNQSNVRFALPSINRRTFEATDLFERMFPRLPSVGVLLEF